MQGIARQGQGFGFCSKSKAIAGSNLCYKKITFTTTWRGGGGERSRQSRKTALETCRTLGERQWWSRPRCCIRL